ncbi:MAG: response regulator [Bdellovibrionota bacterium]
MSLENINSISAGDVPENKPTTNPATNSQENTYNLAYDRLTRLAKKNKCKKTRRILVVEDDQDLGPVLKYGLAMKHGFEVDVAVHPHEAMGLMAENRYDLVILDWNLPELTGGQAMREFERTYNLEMKVPWESELKKTPVVVVSSQPKSVCRFPRSSLFSFVGFIDKRVGLSRIMDMVEENYLKWKMGNISVVSDLGI